MSHSVYTDRKYLDWAQNHYNFRRRILLFDALNPAFIQRHADKKIEILLV